MGRNEGNTEQHKKLYKIFLQDLLLALNKNHVIVLVQRVYHIKYLSGDYLLNTMIICTDLFFE